MFDRETQLIEEKISRIVLACRTQKKADKTKLQLQSKSDTQLEAFGGFDMSNRDSIKTAIQALPENKPFDIIFLQAGGMVVADDFQFVTVAGKAIEKTIYQNVIGGYLTLKYLEEQNLIAPNARIVFAGGEGARGIKGMIGKPEFNSLDNFLSYIHNGEGKYSDINALGVSKFMSALLVQKLARRNDDREYIWFSPGLTAGTKGLINVPNPKKFIMERIGFPMMQLFGLAQNPKQAAKKYVGALSGKYGKNGELIGAPDGKALGKLVDQKPMNLGLTNQQFIDAFWNIVAKLGNE